MLRRSMEGVIAAINSSTLVTAKRLSWRGLNPGSIWNRGSPVGVPTTLSVLGVALECARLYA